MTKYIRKPEIVEAVRYKRDNINALMDWIESDGVHNSDVLVYNEKENEYWLKTPDKALQLTEGAYIIKGSDGEFSQCKPDVFDFYYKRAE